MNWREVAKQNEGIHSVESFSLSAGVKRGTAINYLHFLHFYGFTRIMRGKGNKRLYEISPLRLREIGYPSLIGTINSISPVKLTTRIVERLDHKLSPEEAIPMAIETKDHRIILASLALFRHVSDWWELYRFSRKKGLGRNVGALYSVARKCMRVRSIDKRVLSLLKKSRLVQDGIVSGSSSNDFTSIEKEWGIRIPFSTSDLAVYR